MAALFRRNLMRRNISNVLFNNNMNRYFSTAFVQGDKIKTQPVVPYCSGNDDARNSAIEKIFEQKTKKGLSIDDIASELGYTNMYTAQILSLKTPLNPGKATLMGDILDLEKATLNEMVKAGLRRYDPNIC
eukprot:943808_1